MSSKLPSVHKTQIPSARKTELDVLRVLCCFMVICIHLVFQGWNTLSTRSLSWQGLNLCNSLVRGGIPTFVMLSGINFLKEEKPFRLLLRKYILRIAVLFALWTFFYAADQVGFAQLASVSGWKNILYQCFDEKYHLWYLTNTFGAYLALPLLWPVVHYKDGKYLRYVLWLYLTYSGITCILQLLPNHNLFMPTVRQVAPAVTTFPCLMLIGYYFYEYEPIRRSNAFWITAFFAIALITAALNGCLSYHRQQPENALLENFSFASILEGICLLHIFKNMRFTKYTHLWTWLSSCTLGIYLLHVFALEHLQKYLSFNIFFAPLPISLPILTVCIFLICFVAASLLKRIPFIGKWIV